MAFHDSQIKAIKHNQGPALILAGPGSGKTTVITHRIQYLIEYHNVSPNEILVITFTRAAAREMQDRFLALRQGQSSAVTFGTFHSIFFRMLKHAYNYNAANILKEEEQYSYLREVIHGMALNFDDEQEFVQGILSEIGMVKNSGLSLAHYYAKNCPEEVFRKIYEGYERKLREMNKVDFDDILLMTLELLKARTDILAVWQRKYRYILVDEFQDINRIQYEIVRLLAAPADNLFIVGDDDQSIYRFRGAKPEIMLAFERDYPNAMRTVLDVNYRCDQHIVTTAGKLIVQNKQRFNKQIRADHPAVNPVSLTICKDPPQQGRQIVNAIKEYHQAGVPYQNIAILFRTNIGARPVMEALLDAAIPFSMKERIPNLFEHWIARDILAYIQIAYGDTSRELMLKIMNRPNRYIHREALQQKQISIALLKEYYQDKDWMIERLERLEYDFTIMKKMPPYAAVNYIRNAIQYDAYLREYAEYRRMKPEELMHVADALLESAKQFKTIPEWFAHMREYAKALEEQRLRQGKGTDEDSVFLCTLHQAKGLEFQIVMLPDINEDNIPHNKAVQPAELEEERRLLYVGMTRAKEVLHLYYVKEQYHKERNPSRFLWEMGFEEGNNA